MFLNEVALGKEYRITQDDPSLTKPPDGFDSVLACGATEPGESEGEVAGRGHLWGLGIFSTYD